MSLALAKARRNQSVISIAIGNSGKTGSKLLLSAQDRFGQVMQFKIQN